MSDFTMHEKGLIDFFVGERVYGPYLMSDRPQGKLTCTLIEEWKERKAWSIACGDKHTYVLRKKIGISETDRRELETTISSSLKLKSILEVRTEVKDKIGYEIRIEESIEEDDSFEFFAKECERKDYVVYQFRRIYNFSFLDKRSLIRRIINVSRNKSFDKNICEWIDKVYARPFRIDPHPDCKCNIRKNKYDGFINFISKKIGLQVAYLQDKDQVFIPSLEYTISAKEVENLFFKKIFLNRKVLPKYLLFMAEENSAILEGIFTPYIDVPQREYDKVNYSVPDNFIYFLYGLGIGTGLGIMFARKPGVELRNNIQRTVLMTIKNFMGAKFKHSSPSESLRSEELMEVTIDKRR